VWPSPRGVENAQARICYAAAAVVPIAVLFDLDGLLSDTERLHCLAYRRAFAEMGHELTDAEYRSHWIRQGLGIDDYYRMNRLEGDPAICRARKTKIYDDLVAEQAMPMPGAMQLVDGLHGVCPLAVASSAYRVAVHAVLKKLGIFDRFGAIVTGDDVQRVKPAPDLLLVAAERLGVPPRQCVVLEDAEKGVIAAHRAGMAVIAVPTADTMDNDFSLATKIVTSLCEITFDVLYETVHGYVHGYGEREAERLVDQATTLAELLHADTHYPDGARVLEAGCGTGAQTVILAKASPGATFTCVDRSVESLQTAERSARALDLQNTSFVRADLYDLPFDERSFDHVFVCFVLEHVRDPLGVLRRLSRVLRPGGTITVIEGDHGSAQYHPASDLAQHTIDCLVAVQAHHGGDARIGRRLYPLLVEAGFAEVGVSPRVVYADATRPAWVDGFTNKTFIAMVRGAREAALELGLTDPARWDRGIGELSRTAERDGTFTYLFYKAIGLRTGNRSR
jgi:HAD superfamily hydrolase (TIGR01509 family)